jgi:hypothetical protein
VVVDFDKLLAFPNPVNEVSARLVAGGVALLTVTAIGTEQLWITALIAYGFVARVLAGPTLSPLGLLVTKVITPRLPVAPRYVPGPPKRFAQGVGAVVSIAAAVLALAFQMNAAAYALLGILIAAATLEAVFAFCVGCSVFGFLMRVGLIPDAVCERCSDASATPAHP